MRLLLKNGIIISMNPQKEIMKGDILIENDKIKKIEKKIENEADEIIELSERVVLPGFVQSHVHLSQTIFRNSAENRKLLEWLEERIYPLESLHTPESLRISAMLGITEMLKSGVTTIVDFGSVKYYEEVIETIYEAGIRAGVGKIMMDKGFEGLREKIDTAIDESVSLLEKWHNKEKRIFYLLEPRFVLSSSFELLRETVKISESKNVKIHTHTSENKQETEKVKEITGMLPFEYYEKIGMVGKNVFFAHAVYIEQKEIEIIKKTKTGIVHCPITNLKLGSGIAPVPILLRNKINVGIGSDGAPANNNLDIFQEMKTASLIHRPFYGIDELDAFSVLEMATVNGARLLGIENITGTIEEEKKADLVILNLEKINSFPYTDLYSAIVFSASSSNVEMVFVDGKMLVKNGKLLIWDEEKILKDAKYIFKKTFLDKRR